MDMKKTAKKISALVAGATMIGATIMGASADLGTYPAPFVTNGVFNGKIVVGERAATSDVVGAIDLAASLQAQSTSTSEVNVPGAAGEASVEGDSAEFRTGSDVLAIGEAVSDAKETFTANDLDALKGGVLSTGSSTTPVKQYLKFANTTMYVQYVEDTDNDVAADFLYVPDNSYLFEYHLEFTEGAESDLDGSELEDLENEVLTILGAPFTITSTTANFGTDAITLELLGGQVADVLRDGETKTYTIDGVDYEVTAVFISDASPASAKISVNGVITKELEEGETEVLGDDVTVGIQSILTNQREGLVEFYLGANKLELTDTSYNNTAYVGQGSVDVREESVDEEDLIIHATEVDSNTLKINYIKYIVAANDEYFVPAGEGLRMFAEEENEGAFLTGTWDVLYAGLVDVAESEIRFNPNGEEAYDFEFENLDGDVYEFPLATAELAQPTYGDDDDRFWFSEPFNFGGAAAVSDANTSIADNDYFIVSDRPTTASEDKAITNVLRYQSISTGDNTVTFKDLAGGDIVVSYSGTLGSTATGELIVAGASHTFMIGSDEELMMDLDADGAIQASDEVRAVTMGGGIVDFGTQNSTAQADTPVVGITTPASQFDEDAHGAETSNATITFDLANDQVGLSVQLAGAGDFVDDPEDDDYERGYSDYGVFFELYNPSGTDEAEELTILYPGSQRYAQVFVTAGTVEVAEGSGSSSGKLMTSRVNEIAVGLAVLDSEAPALGSTNLIVVGGPCVNTVAAELMGNPVDCAEGFTPGKAVIKLFESRKALLVAGYSAQDTLGATYVLADAADYDLSGTEVEVVVTSLDDLDVNVVE